MLMLGRLLMLVGCRRGKGMNDLIDLFVVFGTSPTGRCCVGSRTYSKITKESQ